MCFPFYPNSDKSAGTQCTDSSHNVAVSMLVDRIWCVRVKSYKSVGAIVSVLVEVPFYINASTI